MLGQRAAGHLKVLLRMSRCCHDLDAEDRMRSIYISNTLVVASKFLALGLSIVKVSMLGMQRVLVLKNESHFWKQEMCDILVNICMPYYSTFSRQ